MKGTHDCYPANADRFAKVYEGIPFEYGHRTWLHFVPVTPSALACGWRDARTDPLLARCLVLS